MMDDKRRIDTKSTKRFERQQRSDCNQTKERKLAYLMEKCYAVKNFMVVQ